VRVVESKKWSKNKGWVYKHWSEDEEFHLLDNSGLRRCSESFRGMSDVLIRMQLIILLRPTRMQTILFKPRSIITSWQVMTSDEIFVALDLIILMGYCSRVAFLETFIFPQTMTQDRFELIT